MQGDIQLEVAIVQATRQQIVLDIGKSGHIKNINRIIMVSSVNICAEILKA